MRRIYTIMLAVASSFALLSCVNSKELEEEFVKSMNGLGLEVKGYPAFEYNETDCQYGNNVEKKEFWVAKDDMSDYFSITLDRLPSVGGECTATVVYTTPDNIITKTGIKFTLLKIDELDQIWFWSKQSKIGAVVAK